MNFSFQWHCWQSFLLKTLEIKTSLYYLKSESCGHLKLIKTSESLSLYWLGSTTKCLVMVKIKVLTASCEGYLSVIITIPSVSLLTTVNISFMSSLFK